jgi:galactokinase
MDQYASMFGVKKSALLLDCRTLEAKRFKIDFGNYKLLLINTNVQHDLSESVYNDRRSVCEKAAKKLNIPALRDASKEDLGNLKKNITEEDYQKVVYIIEENERVTLFAKAIQQGDLKTLGKLMYQSHDGLSDQYKVSCVELDFLVEKTKTNPDILGSRMMGGGFGGCTINLIKKRAIEKFSKDIAKAYQMEFNRNCSIYSVKLSDGTRIIN